MKRQIKKLIPIILASIVPTLLIWTPFFFRFKAFWSIPLKQDGMATIVANFDGPLFLVVAKSFYNPEVIKQIVSFPLPSEYYTAHFPLFPLLIRLFAFALGFPYAMLAVTILSSILATYFFSRLIVKYTEKKDRLWLTLVFCLFPARWLVVKSVGSVEPLFIAAIIASLYYFQKKRFLLAGIWGALAQLTKSPAVLLFLAYILAIIYPKIKRLGTQSIDKWILSLNLTKYAGILLIPISLLGLFFFYQIRLNDFLAYFHSGDNIHLFFPPFSIFNYSSAWVGTFWLEEIIFVYLLGLMGLIELVKQKRRTMAWFVGIFFASTLFVSHRDLIRYSLPIVPFLLIAFSNYIVKREFKIIMAVIIIPIYLFSLAYISQNTMPISDWGPLL